MVSYVYLGYGVTDSNGVARLDHNASGTSIDHSYTGTGAGEIDVVASLDSTIGSGSVVSQPYEVIDAIWYDEAVDGHENSDLWINSNLSKTASSDGTLITNDTGTRFFGLNKNGTTASSENDLYDWTGNSFAVECDILSFSGTVRLQIIDYPSQHLFQKAFSDMIGASSTNKHLKIVANGTDVRCYVDGVENTSMKVTTNFTDTYRIVFRMEGESSIKFKNLVYYPI